MYEVRVRRSTNLGEVIGDVGPASSPERRRAYAEGRTALRELVISDGRVAGWSSSATVAA
jgi:hypothetical protein